MFSLDSDVVHFCRMKNWYFPLVAAQSQNFSHSGECGLDAARSGRTCHLASSLPEKTRRVCSTASSTRNLPTLVTLTRPEGQLMYTAWQRPLSAVFELQPPCRKQYMSSRHWYSETGRSLLKSSTFAIPHIFTHQPRSLHHLNISWKWVYFSKKSSAERDTTKMHFAAWSYFINKHVPLSQSKVSVPVSQIRDNDFLYPCLSASLMPYWLWFKCLFPIWWAITHSVAERGDDNDRSDPRHLS